MQPFLPPFLAEYALSDCAKASAATAQRTIKIAGCAQRQSGLRDRASRRDVRQVLKSPLITDRRGGNQHQNRRQLLVAVWARRLRGRIRARARAPISVPLQDRPRLSAVFLQGLQHEQVAQGWPADAARPRRSAPYRRFESFAGSAFSARTKSFCS